MSFPFIDPVCKECFKNTAGDIQEKVRDWVSEQVELHSNLSAFWRNEALTNAAAHHSGFKAPFTLPKEGSLACRRMSL